tara:strand:- start:9432 stop:9677 length:246 start_codon:yes stop_codon:yes gene_type:complete
MKPKNATEVEYQILRYLIHGNGSSMGDLSSLAEKYNAGLDSAGKPIDPVSHRRFNTAVERVSVQLNRLLEQRMKKLGVQDE